MRVALAGKGGVGKTTVAAGLASFTGRAGRDVVAIDADSNPNLAAALGCSAEEAGRSKPLPHTLVSRRLGGPLLAEGIGDVLAQYALRLPDRVRLLLMGMPEHAGDGCLCAAHTTVSAVLGDLGSRDDVLTVVDLEASPEHLSRGTIRHVDLLLIVTEPYYRALETAKRLAHLAAELPVPRVLVLANKVRSEAEDQAVRAFCARHDLQLAGSVPFSDDVMTADIRRGSPFAPGSGDTASSAVRDVAGWLLGTFLHPST